MAADWLHWLANATLASSGAIVLVLLMRPPWRRGLGAGGVLWLWLLLPAALVATSLPRPTVVTERAIERASAQDLSTATPAPTAESTPVDGPRWIVALWLSGALLLAVRLVRQQRDFLRRLGQLSRRDDGSFTASTSHVGPAVIGAWRPRIVLPADFEQRYDTTQRTLILAHERCHLRRGDLQVNLLLGALRCVFWFNPLVHLASNKLRLDQELACDASVLRLHPEAGRAYATALLNTQLADLGLPVGCQWQSSHPLKWRIAMLKRPMPGPARMLLGAALATLASSAAATTLWQALPVNTVVLPVVLPARPAAALPPLETLAALPALPALSVTLGALPAPATPADLPAPADAPVPATTPSPTAIPAEPAPAAGDYQPPRVTRIWVATRPSRTPFHQRDADIRSETDVVVQVDVGVDGKPSQPRIVRSTLDHRHQAAALRAVKRWQFEPAYRDGVAEASTVIVPVAFEPAMGKGPLRSDPSVRQSIGYSRPPPSAVQSR